MLETAKVTKDKKNADTHIGEHIFCYSWPVEGDNQLLNEGVCFINVDLAGVTAIRDYVEAKAQSLGLDERQSFELSLISDELVANAVVATSLKELSEIVVFRWKHHKDNFGISVLDYGGGLDLPRVYKEIPVGDTLEEFINELKVYKDKSSVKVRNHGKIIEHARFGRGLRIVNGLVDSLGIKFHAEGGTISKTISKETIGTIISVIYNTR